MKSDRAQLMEMLLDRTELWERRQRRVRALALVAAIAPFLTAVVAVIYGVTTGRRDILLWAVIPATVALLNVFAYWRAGTRLAIARYIICWSTLIGLALSTLVYGIQFGIMAAFTTWTILLFALLFTPQMALIPAGVTVLTVLLAAGIEALGIGPFIDLDDQAAFVGNLTIALVYPLAMVGTVHAYADYLMETFGLIGQLVRQETTSLTEANQMVATSVQQQASAVQEISATAEELARTAERLTTHSRQLNDVVEHATQEAREGGQLIGTILDQLVHLGTSMQDLARQMVHLGEQSQRIGEIVEIIQRISDDTHLIALNASIEAASAGQHGQRFGAIAAEIRRLAEDVLKASGEVRRIIPDLQQGLQNVVLSLESGVQRAEELGQQAQTARNHLKQMVDSFEDIAIAAQELRTVAEELASVSEEMRASMNDLSQVTHRLADISHQNVQTAESLDALVALMPRMGL